MKSKFKDDVENGSDNEQSHDFLKKSVAGLKPPLPNKSSVGNKSGKTLKTGQNDSKDSLKVSTGDNRVNQDSVNVDEGSRRPSKRNESNTDKGEDSLEKYKKQKSDAALNPKGIFWFIKK